MKINFVYHTLNELGSGYMGSDGLRRALEDNGALGYVYNQTGDEPIDVEQLQSNPILYVRGFLHGRMPFVARGGNQFKAAWQSESYYTRRGDLDVSTPAAEENQDHFNMYFTCAESDVSLYRIPTYFLPSWADISVLDEKNARTKHKGLGFIGGCDGRLDFLEGDKRGILNLKRTEKIDDPYKRTAAYADLMSSFDMLVSPPGRCFVGMCGRAFEIMACRRLCFQYLNEDTMFEHMKFFEHKKDIVYFHDWEELNELYDYYNDAEEEREAIATSGYNKVRQFHNQHVRAKYIVDCMSREHAKWKKDQAKISPEINRIYAEL